MLISHGRRRDQPLVPNGIGPLEGQHVLEVQGISADHLQEAPEDVDGALNLQVAGSEQFAVEVNVVCEGGFNSVH